MKAAEIIDDEPKSRLRLLIDKPTVSVIHVCDTCVHKCQVTGPGYERYFCQDGINNSGMVEIKEMVNSCTAYYPKRQGERQLTGQMKVQAWSIIQIAGRLEILNPEEAAAWQVACERGDARKFKLNRPGYKPPPRPVTNSARKRK